MGGVIFRAAFKELSNVRIGPLSYIPQDAAVPEQFTAPYFNNFLADETVDLGTYQHDTEVFITNPITDPDGIAIGFELVDGTLPNGLAFNDLDGSFSGYPTVTSTSIFEVILAIVTPYGNVSHQRYSITIEYVSQGVTWETDPNLGTYSAGQTVDQEVVAN